MSHRRNALEEFRGYTTGITYALHVHIYRGCATGFTPSEDLLIATAAGNIVAAASGTAAASSFRLGGVAHLTPSRAFPNPFGVLLVVLL